MRITKKQLTFLIDRINLSTGSPQTYWTDGKINAGHYHLDNAYGGWKLVRTVNDGGGETDVVYERLTTGAMYTVLQAFLAGIVAGKTASVEVA